MATEGDSLAMRCLRDACDASGLPQKALAGPRSLKQFNKLLNGVQAFPVAALDALPADVADDFVARYGTQRGLIVRRPTREEDLARLAESFAEATRIVLDITAAFVRRGRP